MGDIQFFSLEALTSVVAAIFVVAGLTQLIKLWWSKLGKGKPMWRCILATLPYIFAVPVFIGWSAYHNEGKVIWSQAPYMVIVWGASSAYVYDWVISKIKKLNPGGTQ